MISEESEETMDELKRFCADCKTTRTPLWRTGPYGPRSLCNACGIRYRKRKTADDSISAEINSEKSSSSNRSGDHQEIQMDDSEKERIAQTQRPFSSCSCSCSCSSSSQLKKQRSRRDSSINSNSSSLKFSEVEEAAVLLMSMSCNSVFA